MFLTDPQCTSIGNGCFLAEPSCQRYLIDTNVNSIIVSGLSNGIRLICIKIRKKI